MTPFPGRFWLENWRVAVQSVWFCEFGIALFLSTLALHFPRRAWISVSARAVWTLSIAFFVGMWIAGATLEMMRRTASVSGSHLVVALGAFSLLLAGTVSLAREGFGATWKQPLRAGRMSLTLLILTLAGWFFGGLSLEWNALWNLAPRVPIHPRAPDGWALSLGGAALWGAASRVKSSDETGLRVKNPRAWMWFLLGTGLLLSLPIGARNAAAASVFCFGAGLFSFKIWRQRADCPRYLRSNWRLRGPLLMLLSGLPFLAQPNRSVWATLWQTNLAQSWRDPAPVIAIVALSLMIWWLLWRGRAPLRGAIAGQFSTRALLGGALGGFLLAALLFGPAGAIFWAFWPLAGVFFDLLSPRETFPDSAEPTKPSDFARQLRAGELAAPQSAP